MTLSLLISVDMITLQTTEACFKLDMTKIKYGTYIQSREESLKVMGK
jgi:hypothetical protein